MIEIKFVDMKYLEHPLLWNKDYFIQSRCNFNSFGLATILCPAINQIIKSKGILYLFPDSYALTCKDSEETGIRIACARCKFKSQQYNMLASKVNENAL